MPAIEKALSRVLVGAVALGCGGTGLAGAGEAIPLAPDAVKPLNVEVAAVEYRGKAALRLNEKPGVAVEADSLAV